MSHGGRGTAAGFETGPRFGWWSAAVLGVAVVVAVLSFKDSHLYGAGVAGTTLSIATGRKLLLTRQSHWSVRGAGMLTEFLLALWLAGLLAARSTMLPLPERLAMMQKYGSFPSSCTHTASCTRVAEWNSQRTGGMEPQLVGGSHDEIFAVVKTLVSSLPGRKRVHVAKEERGYLHVEILSPLLGLGDHLAVQVDCVDTGEGSMARLQMQAEGTVDGRDLMKNQRRIAALSKLVLRAKRSNVFSGARCEEESEDL